MLLRLSALVFWPRPPLNPLPTGQANWLSWPDDALFFLFIFSYSGLCFLWVFLLHYVAAFSLSCYFSFSFSFFCCCCCAWFCSSRRHYIVFLLFSSGLDVFPHLALPHLTSSHLRSTFPWPLQLWKNFCFNTIFQGINETVVITLIIRHVALEKHVGIFIVSGLFWWKNLEKLVHPKMGKLNAKT